MSNGGWHRPPKNWIIQPQIWIVSWLRKLAADCKMPKIVVPLTEHYTPRPHESYSAQCLLTWWLVSWIIWIDCNYIFLTQSWKQIWEVQGSMGVNTFDWKRSWKHRKTELWEVKSQENDHPDLWSPGFTPQPHMNTPFGIPKGGTSAFQQFQPNLLIMAVGCPSIITSILSPRGKTLAHGHTNKDGIFQPPL